MSKRGRPRGSLVNVRRISLLIEADADERINTLAAAVGSSRSALIQWLVEHVDTDAHGKPVGWDAEHPRAEELPIANP